MIKRFILIIFVSVLIFGGLFGWKFYQIGEAMKHIPLPPPAVVAATEVKVESWQPYLASVGSLVAVAGVDVNNEISGIVKSIHFDSGQSVKQGQLLVILDTSTLEAELKGLIAAEGLAQARFDRSEKLIAQHFISKNDYDQTKAQLDQAKAAVATNKTMIDKKQIRAPFSGKLGIRLVNLGQYLEEGSAIVPLQKLDPIYVDFMLPESRLSALAVGQKLELTVQAYPGQTFSGAISALNPGIDIGTRSIKVRATLDNKHEILHPGMFADVKLLTSEKRQVLTVPDTAITYNPYGDSVFTIEGNQHNLTVKIKQIVTGETRNGRVEIVKGLNPGEKIVSAGQVKLRNDMPVTIDDKPAPGERENSL